MTHDIVQTAYEISLERLRADPEADMADAFIETKRRVGWPGSRMDFARKPWRSAKMAERKERTGSAHRKKREAAAQPERAATERGSTAEPAASRTLELTTGEGTLLVRPDGGERLKLIFSASLDRTSVSNLVPLLSGVLHAGALR